MGSTGAMWDVVAMGAVRGGTRPKFSGQGTAARVSQEWEGSVSRTSWLPSPLASERKKVKGTWPRSQASPILGEDLQVLLKRKNKHSSPGRSLGAGQQKDSRMWPFLPVASSREQAASPD